MGGSVGLGDPLYPATRGRGCGEVRGGRGANSFKADAFGASGTAEVEVRKRGSSWSRKGSSRGCSWLGRTPPLRPAHLLATWPAQRTGGERGGDNI